MHANKAATLLLPLFSSLHFGLSHPLNPPKSQDQPHKQFTVVQTGDDSWADNTLRETYNRFTEYGIDTIISATAVDWHEAGAWELGHPGDFWATEFRKTCEYSSCPLDAPPIGYNVSEPRFNYVHSPPIAAVEYGIDVLAPKFFGGLPDLVVAGVNNGLSTGQTARLTSGVYSAAQCTARNGIPAIAFSGYNYWKTPWYQPPPMHSVIYADLATNITLKILQSGPPYLPQNTFLNVNFPRVDEYHCTDSSKFKFVLSRGHKSFGWNPKDAYICGHDVLPMDDDVITRKGGCYVSIAPMRAGQPDGTQEPAVQEEIVRRLGSMLSCFPRKDEIEEKDE